MPLVTKRAMLKQDKRDIIIIASLIAAFCFGHYIGHLQGLREMLHKIGREGVERGHIKSTKNLNYKWINHK